MRREEGSGLGAAFFWGLERVALLEVTVCLCWQVRIHSAIRRSIIDWLSTMKNIGSQSDQDRLSGTGRQPVSDPRGDLPEKNYKDPVRP